MNDDLLVKLANEPGKIGRVDDFYSGPIKNQTPTGFTGSGVYNNVYYNKFGMPVFDVDLKFIVNISKYADEVKNY